MIDIKEEIKAIGDELADFAKNGPQVPVVQTSLQRAPCITLSVWPTLLCAPAWA